MLLQDTIRKIPFIRFLLIYITGIVCVKFTGFKNSAAFLVFTLIFIVLLLLLLIWISEYPALKRTRISGLTASLLLFLTGMVVMQLHNRIAQTWESTAGQKGWVVFRIDEQPVIRKKTVSAFITVQYTNIHHKWQKHHQKMIAYFSKDTASLGLDMGQMVIAPVVIQSISSNDKQSSNNYQKYLHARNIYNQVYIKQGSWRKLLRYPHKGLRYYSVKTQQYILDAYRKISLDHNAFGILSAITMGYKADIEPGTKQLFSKAGIMHVMALSGFNVVIIAMLLEYLLFFANQWSWGRITRSAITVLFIWFFAFITGLSPSVTRASAMITLVIAGKHLGRSVKTSNILLVSAFVIITISPQLIDDISFQLSFTAVLGILMIQPSLSQLMIFKNRLIRAIWQLFTVSCAAQMATLPITIYYFNQFPVYFWLTNLYAVPLVSVIICMALVYLAVSFLPLLAYITGKILGFLLFLLYQSLTLVEFLPFSIIENVHINVLQVFLLFVIFMLLAVFLHYKSAKYLIACLSFIAIFQLAGILKNIGFIN